MLSAVRPVHSSVDRCRKVKGAKGLAVMKIVLCMKQLCNKQGMILTQEQNQRKDAITN